MHMTILHRSGFEIQYPISIPPIIRGLITVSPQCNVMRFRLSNVHVLSAADIESGFLALPWSSFSRDAFAKNNSSIPIVDQSRFNWRCTIQFGQEYNRMICKIGGDWKAICVLRNFRVGHAIKLGISGEGGADVVYLRHTPLQCTHTSYIHTSSNGVNEKFVYQVNHYFMRCPTKKEST